MIRRPLVTDRSTSSADSASLLRSGDAPVPSACLAAGAVLHTGEWSTVVAHYGSVAAEIAVCLKSVGLADHSDYGVLELRGDRALLDRALTARLGDPPLAIGSARRLRDVWYLRLDARRTLLVGPRSALASGPMIGRGRDRAELQHHDIGSSLTIVGIVGPRAARLVAAVGLPDKLAIGAIGRDGSDPGVVAILRESQRRYLGVVRRDRGDAFWARLVEAGKPLGAAFVGCDALSLLNVSADAAG
jgi:glycine cleavage system aminomethyltransferase T